MNKILKFLLVSSLLSVAVWGQGEADTYFRNNIDRQNIEDRNRNGVFPIAYLPKRVPQITKKGKKLLNPSVEVIAENKDFLKQSNTGIAKIFASRNCNRFVIDINNLYCSNLAEMVGQGTFYSFRKKENRSDKWADISFENEEFKVINSNGLQGIWADFGDVPINLLTNNSDLRKIFTSSSIDNFARENGIDSKIVSSEKFPDYQLLPNNIHLKAQNTYVLLLSESKGKKEKPTKQFLIVLRVIKQNEDGSVTFIWKKN